MLADAPNYETEDVDSGKSRKPQTRRTLKDLKEQYLNNKNGG